MFSSRRKSNISIYYSMAEFVYVLLFVSIGIAAFLYMENGKYHEEIESLKIERSQLVQTVQHLQEELEKLREKEKAQLSCDAVEGSGINNIIAVVTIKSNTSFEIMKTRNSEKRSVENVPEELTLAVLRNSIEELFSDTISFSRVNQCFLRAQLLNETNDYSLYLKYKRILQESGIAVIVD